MQRTLARALPALFVLASAPLALAEIRYVDADLATGANDGTSWANAFQGAGGLQAALAVAIAGDEIFVAEGTYTASQTGLRTASFVLKNGVAIYGSFLGTESSPDERPPFDVAPSVLEGDLAGNDASGIFTDNTYHLVVAPAGTDQTAILDGFVVARGAANGTSAGNNDRGGGILGIGNVNPWIRNCRFVANRATFGGAAGYLSNGARPAFHGCRFEDGNGGSFGGAFDIANGGAVLFDRCVFERNTAARAGALEIFASNGVIVMNSLFRDNVATGTGGGGGIWIGSGGNPRVLNCTVVGNASTTNAVGGIRVQTAANAVIANCIVWDNQGPGGVQGPNNQVNAAANVTYSIVEGGFAGTGNLSADPEFADLANGDLSLTPESPAVDAGTNFALPVGSIADLAGLPRLVDVPTTPDTGAGTAPIVDIGAFELPPPLFASVAGCAGNPALLEALSPSATVGAPFTLRVVSSVFEPGVGVLYAGVPSIDAGGCGLFLPGLGELLLAVAPAPFLVGSGSGGGLVNFALGVPNDPALAGLAIGLEAAYAALVPGIPLQLSNLLVATIQP